MRSRIRRNARLALVLMSLATVAGAGTVLGRANEPNDSSPVSGSLVERAPIANLAEAEHVRSHRPGDCRDLNASFLDPACHSAELHKRRPSHAGHRVATVLIGRVDARDPEAE
jgi:hypothetical protein